MSYPVPANEAARLRALNDYQVLDTLPEEAFDRVAHLASRLFDVPTALISMMDANRQWFKSCVSPHALTETSREVSFCSHALLQDDVMVIPDAREDPRFCDNPLVTGPFQIRFYAGAPLKTPGGFNVGTLCLIDQEPGTLTETEQATLADLAAVVVDELELRSEIAQREEAETALRESEERFRKFVHHASDVTTILGVDGTIRYESPAVQDVLGYASGARVGQNAFESVHPDDTEELRARFKRLLDHPEGPLTVQFRMRHADGSWVHLEAVGNNLLDDPDLQGVLVHSRDVTDSVRYEAEREARRHAEELLEAKTNLMNNVSHELRTPLAGILGFAKILAEEVEGEHAEFVRLIQRSGQRLHRTIDALLDLAQMDAGQANVTLRVLDVAAEVQEAIALFAPAAREKDLTLRVASAAKAHAHLDADHLRSILNNLLGNAIKFTEAGGVAVNVLASNGQVSVQVADTGVGIDAAFLPHLFESFRQESSGLTRTHEGNGLGLAITKRLVEIMGGAIEAESQKGVGTTFTVSFPACSASDKTAANAAQAAQAAHGQAGRLTRRSAPQKPAS